MQRKTVLLHLQPHWLQDASVILRLVIDWLRSEGAGTGSVSPAVVGHRAGVGAPNWSCELSVNS